MDPTRQNAHQKIRTMLKAILDSTDKLKSEPHNRDHLCDIVWFSRAAMLATEEVEREVYNG